jgi:hypothetical protein
MKKGAADHTKKARISANRFEFDLRCITKGKWADAATLTKK